VGLWRVRGGERWLGEGEVGRGGKGKRWERGRGGGGGGGGGCWVGGCKRVG